MKPTRIDQAQAALNAWLEDQQNINKFALAVTLGGMVPIEPDQYVENEEQAKKVAEERKG